MSDERQQDEEGVQRHFAAQLRLLAQKVEAGDVQCAAVVMYSRCVLPGCGQKHPGSALMCAGADVPALLGALRVLEAEVIRSYLATGNVVGAFSLQPVPDDKG